jgi:A49-like RNA polymerase I associated factor
MPSSNKRKSKTAPSSSPSASSATTTATIRVEVAESNPAANPIVVSFPGGMPQAAGGSEGSSSSLPKFYWQRLNEKSKSGRKVVGIDRHCTYEAYAKGLAFDDRRTKLCVGVYDRKRGVVTIHEAASKGTVFSLRQSVPSYNTNGGGHIETKPGEASINRSQVFEDFGSSKKRKVLKSQAANQVDIDNVVGAGEGSAMVDQIMSGRGMSKSNKEAIEESRRADADSASNRLTAAERALQEARRMLLPEYDENAVEAHKIYDPKTMVGDDAWSRFHKKVHACFREHDDKDNALEAVVDTVHDRDRVDFVIQSMRKSDSSSAKESTRRLTCALLANYMIKFYKNNNKKKTLEGPDSSKAFYYGIPIELAERCFELFTTGGTGPNGKAQYVMTKANKEKAVVHILLMFMLAQGKTMKIVDLKKVADELKLPVQDCATFLRYAGCKITKKERGTLISAVLTTPLEFPSMTRGGPSRGGR